MACLLAAYKRHERGRDQAQDRADVDDPAAALLAHLRQHGAGHADRAEEIGLEQRASLLDRALLRRAGDAEARVVDQHVDAAGSVEHLAHRAGHRLIVGDVERQEHHSVRASRPAVALRLVPYTVNPAPTSARAAASPIPDDAPVTSATRPVSTAMTTPSLDCITIIIL